MVQLYSGGCLKFLKFGKKVYPFGPVYIKLQFGCITNSKKYKKVLILLFFMVANISQILKYTCKIFLAAQFGFKT